MMENVIARIRQRTVAETKQSQNEIATAPTGPRDDTKAPRILIVRTDRMGDVILSTPVIRALRTAYPDGYLAMMVRPAHRELVEGNPDLNEVILYDKEGVHQSIWATIRFAWKLRAGRFHDAVILHSTNRVLWICWLAGIPRRAGYARRLPWLLSHPLSYGIKAKGDLHELEYNLKLLGPLGVETRERSLFVPVTAVQEKVVLDFLSRQGVGRETELAVIHPGASCSSKRWKPERFAQVADRLSRTHGLKIVVLTGPGEEPQGEEVLRQMQSQAISALGCFSLGETAALLARGRCLISNDSGPVHLAGAMGTPVVSIFGRWGGGLSPVRWGPTGGNGISLHHDVGCRPCLAHRCPIDFVCLNTVSVEEVVAAAEYLLRNGRMGK